MGEAVTRRVVLPGRVVSIDLLRGLTIAFMILVNDPGDWEHVYSQLDHATWNGWTLTDLVFPTFLFVVGASTVFSIEARERKGDTRLTLAGHMVARAGKLFLLKTVLSLIPYFHYTHMRIFGVLTRIALCYPLAGLVLLRTRDKRVLFGVVAVLLAGYWVLLRWVPVPGAGWPVRDFPLLDKDLNLTAWLDRSFSAWTLKWLHTGTLYEKTRDPEGLLSTLPAIATTLLGALAALWMRHPTDGWWGRDARGMRTMLAMSGAVLVVLGLLWGRSFPINKNLWTSSYVLLMAGFAALGLVALAALVDSRPQPWPRWLQAATWPWFVFGSNAIAAYAASVLLVKGCLYVKLADSDGDKHTLWSLIYTFGFASRGSTKMT